MRKDIDANKATVSISHICVAHPKVTSWPLFSAAGVLAMIPAVVFAAIFQRYIVAGLGAGGVKG